MSQRLEAVSEVLVVEALSLGCHPEHNAPDPYGFLCGCWRGWAHRRLGPRRLFGQGSDGPRAERPDNQALAYGPQHQASLQGEALSAPYRLTSWSFTVQNVSLNLKGLICKLKKDHLTVCVIVWPLSFRLFKNGFARSKTMCD